jgi:hypothetical protein
MHARVGDRFVVAGYHSGGPNRECEVLEVRGTDGGPPYLVRWDESGHEALFYPGPNVTVENRDRSVR